MRQTRHAAHAIVHLHPAAPPKPAPGAACNGCGLCCAAEPCPLGIVLSRRRRGACAALSWVDEEQRYRCGALMQPARWLPRALARRWISAGSGCDCTLEPA